ncbi:hypothetical protein [Gorillibacterium massiliense]|uniref:hypothetical protein n=1 Tax=Gorillibacterium massiliense TaxID=1280390 RepID=UPI0004BBFB93|nr:hypothetical protein [Gorillibacterium massiliense]
MTIKRFTRTFRLQEKAEIDELKILLDLKKQRLLDYDDELVKLQSKLGYYYDIEEVNEFENHIEVVRYVDQSL